MRFAFALICAALAIPAQPANLIEQAQAAFRTGDFDRAVSLAQTVVARNPASVNGHMILGIVAGQRQQWADASLHLQNVIKLAPSDPHGYFYLGQAKLYQSQWNSATQYFHKALRLGYPDKDRLLIELAFAENEANRPEEALARLKEIREPTSGASAAQYQAVTAFAQFRLQRYPEAISSIRTACELDSHNSQYWEFLISSLISTDQTQTALSEAIRAQAIFPDHAEIQYLFALTSFYVPESPLSPLALRNLNEAAPGSPKAVLAAGLLYRKEGRVEEATSSFRQAAKLGVPDSHALLGIIYREQGNAAAAETEFRQAEQANPNNGQVLLELGKLALGRGQAQAALTKLNKAVLLMPASAPAHYQLGLAHSRLGEKEKANEEFSRSRELDRQQAELQGSGQRQ